MVAGHVPPVASCPRPCPDVFTFAALTKIVELDGPGVEVDHLIGLVEQIAFAPDGSWFIAAGGDHNGFISVYETKSGKLIKQEKAPMHVHQFVVNEPHDTVYAVGHQRLVTWELKAPAPKPEMTDPSGYPTSISSLTPGHCSDGPFPVWVLCCCLSC